MNNDKIKELERTIKNDYSNVIGIVVLKNDETIYEQYFNEYTATDPVHIASVTKSIFSALIGIAIDKGYIKSIEQKVLEFFPDYIVKAGEKTIQGITIKDMLTMTAPYKYTMEPYESFFRSDSWIEYALDLLGGDEKTGEFLYSAIVGTHILSGILTKATGKSVLEFARENLFSPLNIDVPKSVFLRNEEEQMAFYQNRAVSSWVEDEQGINPAGWGLSLTAMDMAKIGQLYLNHGKWNGTQIISATWIEESTKTHSVWQLINLAYGYLWWIIDENEHSYAGMGDGGNVIYVNDSKGIVISIASLFVPEAKDRIELIKGYIEPTFED